MRTATAALGWVAGSAANPTLCRQWSTDYGGTAALGWAPGHRRTQWRAVPCAGNGVPTMARSGRASTGRGSERGPGGRGPAFQKSAWSRLAAEYSPLWFGFPIAIRDPRDAQPSRNELLECAPLFPHRSAAAGIVVDLGAGEPRLGLGTGERMAERLYGSMGLLGLDLSGRLEQIVTSKLARGNPAQVRKCVPMASWYATSTWCNVTGVRCGDRGRRDASTQVRPHGKFGTPTASSGPTWCNVAGAGTGGGGTQVRKCVPMASWGPHGEVWGRSGGGGWCAEVPPPEGQSSTRRAERHTLGGPTSRFTCNRLPTPAEVRRA